MSDGTKIEWTDATWNPITGCTLVDDGCRNCYAAELAATRLKNHSSRKGLATRNAAGVAKFTGEVRFNEQWLEQPLRWRKPRMVFVCAHGDLFHPGVPDKWIDEIFGVMAVAGGKFQGRGDGFTTVGHWTSSDGRMNPVRCPNMKSGPHTFQALTKRPDRAREYIATRRKSVAAAAYRHAHNLVAAGQIADAIESGSYWPLPSVWLGTSVSDQNSANARIPDLLETPASVRFISAEPLLGPVDFNEWMHDSDCNGFNTPQFSGCYCRDAGGPYEVGLDWIIVGGESGRNARPMAPSWARSIRDQCAEAGVAFFMKQMSRKGEIPADLLVREFPK